MEKKFLSFTANQILFMVVVALAASVFWLKYSTTIRFYLISGYIQKGTIDVSDSTLRIPSTIVGTDKYHAYCELVKNLKIPSNKDQMTDKFNFIDVNGTRYCGCMPIPSQKAQNLSRLVEYKLFNNKIIYHCSSELYETSLIPANLKVVSHNG
jgi:hypothetical protein